MMTHPSFPPNLYSPLFPPSNVIAPSIYFSNSDGGVGCMRVGCCIMGAWFVKGVASRGGRDKPQNNNGWHEPEFELWTSPAMEAVCSSVTPSPLSLLWLCERDGARNSQGTVRVGSLPTKPQLLFRIFIVHLFPKKVWKTFIEFVKCWPWIMLTSKANIILQVFPNTCNQIL